MRFSDLFKDKLNSSILREFAEKIIREMSELKRQNYYDMQKVNGREREIEGIKQALADLDITICDDFNPALMCDDED